LDDFIHKFSISFQDENLEKHIKNTICSRLMLARHDMLVTIYISEMYWMFLQHSGRGKKKPRN